MITIAWDVDDVLNDLMRAWLKNYSDTFLYKNITENPPHEILNINLKDYLQSLDHFRLSTQYVQLQPVKEALSWFEQYGDHCRHIAITAVPLKAAHVSASWVMAHFGQWIRTFHFVPSARFDKTIPIYDLSKQDALKWFNKVDVIIDDSEHNLENISIPGILFPRPWNKSRRTISETLAELTEMIGND